MKLLTVDLEDGPVDQHVVHYFEGEGSSLWEQVFIHSCEDQARFSPAGFGTDRAAQREELRRKVVGLLQCDDQRGCG